MNVLQLAHTQIRAKFYTRIFASFFFYGGIALMIYADWRIALGLWMVLSALKTEEGAQ